MSQDEPAVVQPRRSRIRRAVRLAASVAVATLVGLLFAAAYNAFGYALSEAYFRGYSDAGAVLPFVGDPWLSVDFIAAPQDGRLQNYGGPTGWVWSALFFALGFLIGLRPWKVLRRRKAVQP